jgi:ribonuclease HII
VIVDRQGGRIQYLRPLQLAFPDASIRILAEDPSLCRYELLRGASRLTVSFAPEADDRHLPVALASMIAKYVRELLMGRMNRWFQQELPALRPTAGYHQDARRFLGEVEPVIERLRLSPARLVRSR